MDLPEKVLPFQKTAWIPIVKDGDSGLTDSKFAGTPYLKSGEQYPICPNCGKPIQLFLQLNLNQIPEQLKGEFGEGLIQLFYCTNEEPQCEVDCNAWEAFAESVVARLMKIEGDANDSPVSVENAFPSKQIVGWNETFDFPNTEEIESLGVELSDEEKEVVWDSSFPLDGEKLSGWAHWIQGIEYPNCRICDETMRLVFQIDSEVNVPFLFGDVGTSHLTQCPIHKEELAFAWACG